MLVHFWGTRGSLPTAVNAAAVRAKIVAALGKALELGIASDDATVEAFVDDELTFAQAGTYGGNSACVQIDSPAFEEIVVCDAGSGLRELGVRLASSQPGVGPGLVVNIVLSHPHWDHIMGFPFFAPAYVPGNIVRIYGCHDNLEQVFRLQNSAP